MLKTTIVHSSNGYTTTLYLTQTSKDVNNNSSVVSYSLKTVYVRPRGGVGAYERAPYGVDGHVTINGKRITITDKYYDFTKASSKVWITGTITIPHNNDGTKTIAASFGISTHVNMFKNVSGSQSGLVLESIPRVTDFSLSASSIELGGSGFTLTLSNPPSSFTHNIQIKIEGGSFVNITDMGPGVSTQSLGPSVSAWADRIDGIKGNAIVRVTTKNGSSTIGYKDKRIEFRLPISEIASDLTIGIQNINGYNNLYLRNSSQLKITLNAKPKFGATIKSYDILITKGNDIIFTSNSQTITTPVFDTTGTIVIQGIVVDSRGVRKTSKEAITLHEYQKPYFKKINQYRVDDNGIVDMVGAYSIVGGSVVFTSALDLRGSFKVDYRVSDSSTWINVFNATGITVNTWSKTQRIATDSEKEYTVRYTLSDGINTIVKTSTIQTGKVVFDVFESGDGFAFGKTATRNNLLDITDKWEVIGGSSVILGSSDNLNDQTRSGFYICRLNNHASTYRNYPIDKAGVLEVYANYSDSFLIQKYTEYWWGYTYMRHRSSAGVWQPWRPINNRLIQKGHSNVKVKSKQYPTYTVTFPREFNTPPVVMVTLDSGAPQLYSVGVTDVTTTNFKMTVYNGHTAETNIGIHWLASEL